MESADVEILGNSFSEQSRDGILINVLSIQTGSVPSYATGNDYSLEFVLSNLCLQAHF